MNSQSHGVLMDQIYRYQRYIYDATRKYYLLGRDQILDEMQVQPGFRILEMGCGTARNLIKLAHMHPDVELYGIDASSEMLKTASAKVASRNLSSRFNLECIYAESVDYRETFGLEEPFDVIFFSYALSMIPTWKESLETALNNLKPGGWLYIVDFWDQADLPRWFQAGLRHWLALFHVRHEPELITYLNQMQGIEAGFTIEPIFGRYSMKTRIQKAG